MEELRKQCGMPCVRSGRGSEQTWLPQARNKILRHLIQRGIDCLQLNLPLIFEVLLPDRNACTYGRLHQAVRRGQLQLAEEIPWSPSHKMPQGRREVHKESAAKF